jgi:SAM-dependent methyltransferase
VTPDGRDVTESAVQAEVTAGWDKVSNAYQSRYAIPCKDVSYGPMLGGEDRFGLLGDIQGLSVLDVGCGGGQNSVAMALMGAGRVVALDPSEAQLDFARALAARHHVEVEFLTAGAERLSELAESFDLIVSFYALMFVEDLGEVFRQFARLLKPGGRFVVSADHPMRISGEWQGDTFAVNNYFASGWGDWLYAFPEQEVAVRMHRYHRPMEAWINGVCSAGLKVAGLLEPLPVDPPDEFGRRSKHGIDSPLNIFTPARLARVPGSLVLWGGK